MTYTFCEVINGEITKYNISRPRTWGNISFGVNATDDEYRAVGLYPVVGEQPAFDPDTQVCEGPVYTVNGQTVDRVYTVRDLTTEELAEREQARREAMQITPRQCRLQLLSMSLLDDVESAIDTMGASAKIEWEYALEVKRTYSLVAAMQQLFSWSDAEMDTFFVEAGKL